MHTFRKLVCIYTVVINVIQSRPWHIAVHENAPTAIETPTIVTAPGQEVRIADIAIDTDRAIALRPLDRTNESHR